MAMTVAAATDDAYLSVRDLVAFLSETPHPISRSELQRLLSERRVPRVRVGRADLWDVSDAAVAHRDWAAARVQKRSSSR